MFRVQIENCFFNDIESNIATNHSADETVQVLYQFPKGLLTRSENSMFSKDPIQIFKNTRNLIYYTNMTEHFAEDFILKSLIGIKGAVYFENFDDFKIFQTVYSRLIKQNRGNKLQRSTKILEDITTYDRFKQIIIELHLEGLHQGIDKVQNQFITPTIYLKFRI